VRQSRENIGDAEDEDGAKKRILAIETSGGDGNRRCAERLRERKSGHQLSGQSRGDLKVAGDQGKYAGDHEAFGADRERAKDQPGQISRRRRPSSFCK
jgi:hypothetical protein